MYGGIFSYLKKDVEITEAEYNQIMAKYDAMNWVNPSFNSFRNVLPDSVVYAKPRLATGSDSSFLGVVNTESSDLNIRELPSDTASIVGTIPKGEYVSVRKLVGNNEWYKVDYQDKNSKNIYGYVSAKYIVDSDTYKRMQQSKSEYDDTSNLIAIGKVVLSSGSLNMRSDTSTSATVKTMIPNGAYVGIVSSSGNWYYVKYYKDTSSPIYYGYVLRYYITITQWYD